MLKLLPNRTTKYESESQKKYQGGWLQLKKCCLQIKENVTSQLTLLQFFFIDKQSLSQCNKLDFINKLWHTNDSKPNLSNNNLTFRQSVHNHRPIKFTWFTHRNYFWLSYEPNINRLTLLMVFPTFINFLTLTTQSYQLTKWTEVQTC